MTQQELEFLQYVRTKQLFNTRKGKDGTEAVHVPMKLIKERFFYYPRDSL